MMKWPLTIFFFVCGGLMAVYGFPEYIKLPPSWQRIEVAANLSLYRDHTVYGLLGVGSACLFFIGGGKNSIAQGIVCQIHGFKWDINDFCRGWLITGKTGSGKTASAIAHIVHQLFTRVKPQCELCMESGKCGECHGSGNSDNDCNSCKGSGKSSKKCKACHGQGTVLKRGETIECKVCHGAANEECKPCQGSGKTACAACARTGKCNGKKHNNLKLWGGVAVDQKGNFFEIIENIAANYDESDRLITLQVRPEGASKDWQPKYRYNLLSYPGIPSSTYAKIIIDTAASLGQDSGGGSGGFFKTQAQLHIEKAMDLLKLLKFVKENPATIALESVLSKDVDEPGQKSDYDFYQAMPAFVSLKNIFTLLTDKETLLKTVGILEFAIEDRIYRGNPEKELALQEIIIHFKQKFLEQPSDQLGGVIGTIYNYLGFFTSDDICEVFCAEENTVEFEAVDRGKIFSVSMPQRFQSERVYVNTIMKLIYYTHALRRFDNPETLNTNNLLVFIADEAQGVITASKDGMTDYTVIDKIREARATVLFAAQSTTSFGPVMKKEQVETLLLNLANQVHYTVADENNAKLTADWIGKEEQTKKSHGYSGGKRSVNYQKTDEHKIKPHVLRAMKKFECVLIHCERGHRKFILKPIGPNGKVPAYYRKIKR